MPKLTALLPLLFYFFCHCHFPSFLLFAISQTLLYADYTQGFGGKFGVQSDRQDKSAAGWDHIEKVEKHESQKGDFICVKYGWKQILLSSPCLLIF